MWDTWLQVSVLHAWFGMEEMFRNADRICFLSFFPIGTSPIHCTNLLLINVFHLWSVCIVFIIWQLN